MPRRARSVNTRAQLGARPGLGHFAHWRGVHRGYLLPEVTERLLAEADEIARMLNSLRTKVEQTA